MPKRMGGTENQDHYKTAGGGGSTGRRIHTQEKRRFSNAEKRATSSRPVRPPLEKPAVAAVGAGTETVRRASQRRNAKLRTKVEHESAERILETELPRTPPQRLLPAASRSTELSDLFREVRSDVQTSVKALRDLYTALASLVRTPVRLFGVLRPTSGA